MKDNPNLWHTCEQCGKKFYIGATGTWSYKKKHGKHDGYQAWFCGWNCMNKWETEGKGKRRYGHP